MRRWIHAWWPAAAWMLVILVATTIPTGSDGWIDLPRHLDKVVHLGLYAGLAWNIGVGLARLGITRPAAWIAGLALGAALAAVDEAHQGWVPGRDASVVDWVADVAGLGTGMLARAVGVRLGFVAVRDRRRAPGHDRTRAGAPERRARGLPGEEVS